ncbi:hypothetical protein GF420_13495 [candidate division GN15 bacterium]|nr:hypothetical protein [candidate division GN15 bacterium]
MAHPVQSFTEEITEHDRASYLKVVTTELTDAQRARILTPPRVYPRQDSILALHWHSEFVPLDMVTERIRATFPNSDLELIIPTDHNTINVLNGYAGAEVDCYSREFARKVQLLIHFEASRLANANVFKNMLSHTFRYRSSQLYEFIDTILEEKYEDRVQEAAATTGADDDLIRFVRTGTSKLRKLIDQNYAITPPEMLRNKIIKYYFDTLRDLYDDRYINRVQIFLQAIKRIVKRHFSFTHFYETHEIIEEVRYLGGGIIVPHPEQFWPILLADYDVDGYEVWNPQSREYTDFLINVVDRKNKRLHQGERPLLITMGDDCHMGEKAKDPQYQDTEKASREIGVQPAWDDLAVRKSLILANIDRRRVIEEYKNRLL